MKKQLFVTAPLKDYQKLIYFNSNNNYRYWYWLSRYRYLMKVQEFCQHRWKVSREEMEDILNVGLQVSPSSHNEPGVLAAQQLLGR
jgi:hypothetical protein